MLGAAKCKCNPGKSDCRNDGVEMQQNFYNYCGSEREGGGGGMMLWEECDEKEECKHAGEYLLASPLLSPPLTDLRTGESPVIKI